MDAECTGLGRGEQREARVGRGVLRATCSAVLAAASALANCGWLAALCRSLWEEVDGPAPAAPETALSLLLAMAALALALWLALSVLVSLLGYLPGRLGATAQRVQQRMTPAVVRRIAAFLVGVSLGGALAPGNAVAEMRSGRSAPAAAADRSWPAPAPVPGFEPALDAEPAAAPAPGFAPASHTASHSPPAPSTSSPSSADASEAVDLVADGVPAGPGWTPSRPILRPQASPRLLAPVPSVDANPGDGSARDEVVVRRGDTLWDIAERHLGLDATEAQVAEAWPRWHEANREVIGDNPHLILPGQRLRPPSLPHAR